LVSLGLIVADAFVPETTPVAYSLSRGEELASLLLPSSNPF